MAALSWSCEQLCTERVIYNTVLCRRPCSFVLHAGAAGCCMPSGSSQRIMLSMAGMDHSPMHGECAGEWPFDGSQRLCAFMIEAALQRLPDSSESLLGIFDLRGFGPRNADFGFFYFMASPAACAACFCELSEPVHVAKLPR